MSLASPFLTRCFDLGWHGQMADVRRTSMGGRSWPDATEPAHGLESQSGGGSDREYSQEYWAWPLPGSGPLGLVVEWPAFDIGETTTSIDGSLLIAAAERAQPVWLEDAGRDSHVSRGAVMRAAQEGRGHAGGTFIDG